MRIRVGAGQRGIAVTACTTGRCYRDQCGVIRGRCTVGGLPTTGVTGLTVPADREGLADRQADQAAVRCTVAVRAVFQVRGGSAANQGVLVTGRTVVGQGGRHQSAVIRSSGMDDTPHAAMTGRRITSYNVCYTKLLRPAAAVTGRAVATGREVLTDRTADQGAVSGVAVHATAMGFRGSYNFV